MTNSELFNYFISFTDNMRNLMERKNNDYAGSQDAFKNLSMASNAFGVGTTPQGIFIRLTDKMSRLANFVSDKEMQVNENIQDTLMDIANYAGLLSAYLAHQAQACGKEKEPPQYCDVVSAKELNSRAAANLIGGRKAIVETLKDLGISG